MKILVCIKQISMSGMDLDDSARWVIPSQSPELGMSRFDENALEEAIQIKERYQEIYPDISIDVISVGPDSAAESIRRAMGMGADRGIHLVTDDGEYVPGYVTASRITAILGLPDVSLNESLNTSLNGALEGEENALVIREAVVLRGDGSSPYDLILTGIMSEDLMQGQVGPMLAELLDIPCITSVVDIQCHGNGDMDGSMVEMGASGKTDLVDGMDITVQREMEGGLKQQVSARFPVLLTIQAGINQPRYPSLSNILKARKKEIFSCDVDTLPSDTPNPLHLVNLEYPLKKRDGKVLEGTMEQKADLLMDILRKRDLV